MLKERTTLIFPGHAWEFCVNPPFFIYDSLVHIYNFNTT